MDLLSWAGEKMVSRARSYKSSVRDLCTLDNNGLLAWVDGTTAYATSVRPGDSQSLSSACSCPYPGIPCKHAVAVILAYLDALKDKVAIPQASSKDIRLLRLSGVALDEDTDADETDGPNSEWDVEDEDEIIMRSNGESRTHGHSSEQRRGRKKEDIVERRLNSMTKEELVKFVMEITARYPAIAQTIIEEDQLKSGKVAKIVQGIRAEINRLSSEPGWSSHWSNEGSIPDYSHVRDRLGALLDAGHADEVLELGRELWEEGNDQVEMSDDEGETGEEIASCMEVVLRAASASSLSRCDQILWIIDTYLDDEFGLLGDSDKLLSNDVYSRTDWSEVADVLLSRLTKLLKTSEKNDFSKNYQRENIMKWALEALEKSERTEELIPLLEREAPITHCYPLLVQYLLAAGRRREAAEAAENGFRKTIGSSSGVAWRLEDQLREMAEGEKDFAMVAAYRALEFFIRPSLNTYQSLEKAVRKTGVWAAVREAALDFLETGQRPAVGQSEGAKPKPTRVNKKWPLPELTIQLPPEKWPRERYPNSETLMRVAIYEKRNDDVLRWHEIARKGRFVGSSLDETVAAAVQKTHPEISIALWKQLAENQIKLVKPAAYQVALRYFREMQKVYARTGREDEWLKYVSSIRSAHKPKRKLMEILDAMEGKRIIDG